MFAADEPALDDPTSRYRSALPYFGSVDLWRRGYAAGGFAFRQNEHYQRRTQRNRCEIATAHGRHLLSVPLLAGKHEACPVTEVRISYAEDWRKRHWASIVAAYASAPYWEEYSVGLHTAFWRKPPTLWAWNWGLVSWVRAELDPGLVLAKAADWLPTVDTRAEPLSPVDSLPAYPQVFTDRTGWQSNVSVLDLLMCRGPRAASYLGGG